MIKTKEEKSMENLEYANAYSEVNEILKRISKEDYEKAMEALA